VRLPAFPRLFHNYSKNQDQLHQRFTRLYTVVLFLIMKPLLVTTLIGNLMVVIAWIISPRLQTPSNGLFLSLAVVDLLNGLITIPFGIIYNYYRRWIFGLNRPLCQMQLITSYGFQVAASLHLIQIAVDRYRILFEGVPYLQRQTLKSVLEFAVVSWSILFWIVSPIAFD